MGKAAKPSNPQTAIALVIIIGLVVGGVLGFTAGRLASGIRAEVVVQCLALVTTAYLTIWNFRRAKEKEAEARQFPEKAKVYGAMLDVIKMVLGGDKGLSEKLSEQDLARKFYDVKHQLRIWGSSESIAAFMAFDDVGASPDMERVVAVWSRIYAAMRKDLGHNDPPGFGFELFAMDLNADARKEVEPYRLR